MLLTQLINSTMLLTADNKVSPALNPVNNGVITPIQGVFYCLKKMVASVARPIILVARIGKPKGLPVSTKPFVAPLSGVENPLRVAAQNFSTFGGGLLNTMESPL